MKILELYSGTQSISKEFRKKGHITLCVELNDAFTKPPYNLDQWTISIADVTVKEVIKRLGGYPDVIWASPLCTTNSMAASRGNHRQAIESYDFNTEKERKRNTLQEAKSDKAKLHDYLLLKTLHLIQDLKPKYWFIENPTAGMRKSPIMQGVFFRYSITYCQYGHKSMKPTDIWTNHPDPRFKPRCKNGDSCHESAPRGSKTGTQGLKGNTERSIIPPELCKHIVEICETGS